MNLTAALALLCLTSSASAGFLDSQPIIRPPNPFGLLNSQREHNAEHIQPMSMHSFPLTCGAASSLRVIKSAVSLLEQDSQDLAVSLFEQDNVPGAGIDTIYNKEEYAPFKTVLKDGFMLVDCVKDYMYTRGDKYGDNKHDYKLGASSGVSIVHYDAFVAKEDRVKITPTVCFEFCRTVPNMGFFGITNGRNCYCTPYFTAMESGHSQCDSLCPGDNTKTCGGKVKSSIFAMHMCGDTVVDLRNRAATARGLSANMKGKVEKANKFVKEMESTAADIMPLFSFVGDSGASNLAQKAKEMSSGTLQRKADETGGLQKKLTGFAKSAQDLSDSPDLKQSSVMIQAERLMELIDKTVAEAEESTEVLDKMMSYVSPPPPYYDTKKALPNYMPVMYFIDDKFDGIDDPKTKGKVAVPTTCTGDLVGLPIVGVDAEACAQVCDDNLVNGCSGFQHFDNHGYGNKLDGKMCFLFSKFNTGFYYTGCNSKGPKGVLETQKETGCYAKYSKFAGGKFEGSGTLKPGGIAGNNNFCKECFKKFTHADRCYTEKLTKR